MGWGLAREAGHRVAHHALAHDGVEEVFAVMRPTNKRAAAMYYDLRLHAYRLRSADLDTPLPGQPCGAAE